jgi:coenzyme F420-reducing hydrogenase alpha subunit
MSSRIVVDPITRIEGHLRIEAQMEGNQIGQAYSSGTVCTTHLRCVHAGTRCGIDPFR